MNFDYFLSKITDLSQIPLPGEKAHDQILPILSQKRREAFEQDKNPKQSSVAALFFPSSGRANILLIERQAYEGVHSAQIGFPGGKVEEYDDTLTKTALREMEEEVGLSRDLPKLIRPLSTVYIPPSRFLVHPFMFYVNELPNLVKDEREVQSIIYFPVENLLEDQSIVEGGIKLDNGMNINIPYFSFQGHKIWGATGMMLSEIKWILREII